jgi:hypothetical protein
MDSRFTSCAFANGHIVHHGWVLLQLSQLIFGGKKNTLIFFTEVWLVPLPHVLVVHSLALIIAHDLAKGPLLTRALKPAANDHA